MFRFSVFAASCLVASAVNASCFDREVVLSRYHFDVPGQPSPNWQDLYLLDMSTTPAQETRLSAGADATPRYDSSFASWSPSGHRLLFVSSRVGHPLTALYAMDPADTDGDMQGDNPAMLTTSNADHGGGHWRTGDKVIYTRDASPSGGDVFIADIATGGDTLSNSQLLASGGDFRIGANWSPAGDAAVYNQSQFVTGSGWVNVIVHLDVAAGAEQALSPPGVSDSGPIYAGQNYATGDHVVFTRRALNGQPNDIFTARIDLSGPPYLVDVTQITATSARTEDAAMISADGACVGFLAAPVPGPIGPDSDFYIIDLATGEERQITTTRDIGSFAWRP